MKKIKKVYVKKSALKKAIDYSLETKPRESMGILCGFFFLDYCVILEIYPCPNSNGTITFVRPDHKDILEVNKLRIVDNTGIFVGWFHSHPIGTHLSDTDRNSQIQQLKVYKKFIGLVIEIRKDNRTPDYRFFNIDEKGEDYSIEHETFEKNHFTALKNIEAQIQTKLTSEKDELVYPQIGLVEDQIKSLNLSKFTKNINSSIQNIVNFIQKNIDKKNKTIMHQFSKEISYIRNTIRESTNAEQHNLDILENNIKSLRKENKKLIDEKIARPEIDLLKKEIEKNFEEVLSNKLNAQIRKRDKEINWINRNLELIKNDKINKSDVEKIEKEIKSSINSLDQDMRYFKKDMKNSMMEKITMKELQQIKNQIMKEIIGK